MPNNRQEHIPDDKTVLYLIVAMIIILFAVIISMFLAVGAVKLLS